MRVRSVGLLLIAGVSTQFGAAFAVTLFDRLGPSGTVFARLALAAIVLLVVWRPRLRGRPIKPVLALGAALATMNFGFYNAIDHIPLGPTVTIEFLGPLAVALAGSGRRLDLAWVALAAAGVALLGGGGTLNLTGVAFAALAGVGWGTYILLAVRVGRDWPQASGLAVAMAVGAVLVAPVGVAQGGGELLAGGLLLATLGVALASSVIPYSLEMFALREIPGHVFGVLMSLEPAIACAAGLVVLGQGLSATDVAAVAAIATASAGATWFATRPIAPLHPQPSEPASAIAPPTGR